MPQVLKDAARRIVLAMCSVAISHGPLASQDLSQLERDRGQAMLGGLSWVLDTLYYDSTVLGDGKLQAELWWRARQAIDTARSWPAILLQLAGYLEGFNDSHTTFLPPRLTIEVDFGWSWRAIGDNCYVTALARNGPASRAGLALGDRLVTVDGIRADQRNMTAIWYAYHLIAPRRTISVVVEGTDGQRRTVVIEGRVRQRPATMDYSNLEHLRALAYEAARDARVNHKWEVRDSVAIWRFDAFGVRDRRIDSQMRDANRYPWLILDVRDNPGGAIETLSRLLGHFFDEEFVAFDQRWRDSTVAYRATPTQDPYRGQVLVLVNRESASSSEILSRILQLKSRARVLGDRTAGAVRMSVRYEMAEEASGQFYQFGMFVTVADLLMPDGSSLEGVGVTPDIEILPTAEDLAAGRDPVLQRALALAGIQVTAEEAARIIH